MVDDYVQANARGLPATRRAIALGGEPAEVVEALPGQFLSWQVFVIRAESVYHLSLFPAAPARPQVDSDVQAAWEAVSTLLTLMGR